MSQQNTPINLARGWPSFDTLPYDLFREVFLKYNSKEEWAPYLQYGYEKPYNQFRTSLASFLGRHYGMELQADRFFLTHGISGAIDMLCTLLTKAGDTIFIEEASYFCVFRIFTDHHLNIVKVPIDENGIIPEELEKLLSVHSPKFLYTIPIHQNPTGVSLSHERRQKIVELSQTHGFHILADEVYQLLSYEPVPLKPLESYNEGGSVISLGAFTKILSAGVRLGWIYASKELIERCHNGGVFFSGGNTNHAMCGLIKPMLDQGLQDRYLDSLKIEMKRRRDIMVAAIEEHLSPFIDYIVPKGGYFIWATLKHNRVAETLFSLAQEQGVEFMVGNRCTLDGGLSSKLRLCFAFRPEEELTQGIIRLKKAFLAYEATHDTP